MSEVLSALGTFVVFAVSAMFAQNAIFSRALGVSRLLKLVEDSSRDTLLFACLLCCIQVISGFLSYFANQLLAPLSFRAAVRPLALVLCCAVAFFIVLAVVVFVVKPQNSKTVIAVLPTATFNTAVMGTMLLCINQSFTLLQTVGFSFGSAWGYLLAMLLVNEGQRKLRSRAVPAAFKGLPITLLYIGILALAFYGFTGHRVSL